MAYQYLQIREQILEEALRSGAEQMPSESEICARFHVSRTTAIKALNSLADDQLVRREAGRGTFLIRSRVRTRVHFLVNQHVHELIAFAQSAAALFEKTHPYAEVRVHPVDSTVWVQAIFSTPGARVICSSHVGFLSAQNLLMPLQEMEGFQETVNAIRVETIEWRRDRQGALVCDALPFFQAPEVLAYNRRYAEQLGLAADRGPRTWHEVREWAARARKLRRGGKPVLGCHLKRDNVLPLSYYLTHAGGRHFIREQNGAVGFDFASGAAWFEFFRGLHADGLMPLYPSEEPDPILFSRSLISLFVSTWIGPQMREHGTDDPIGLCPIPTPGGSGASFAHVNKAELALVRDLESSAKEKAAAWDFLRFLVQDPGAQRLIVEHFSSLAVNREVYAEQQADARFLPFIQALATGRTRCDHPVEHHLMRVLYKYFYAAVFDGQPCAEAAAKAEEICRLHLELTAPDWARTSGFQPDPQNGRPRASR
jgi:ABC-type glycerol-3-phosphate transport system substrate-binding protein